MNVTTEKVRAGVAAPAPHDTPVGGVPEMSSLTPDYHGDASPSLSEFGFTGPHADAADAYLRVRGIDPAVAIARGYRTPTADDLDGFGITGAARDAALFAIPLFDYDGLELPLPQLCRRRDIGDIPGWRAALKFRSARGASAVSTAHPGNLDALHTRDVPLVLTEGVVKADAILSAVGMNDFAVLAYLGVDLPTVARGEKRGSRPGDFLERRGSMRGRDVILAFDGDALSKPGVARGVDRVAALATAAGAFVTILTPPNGVGIDDCLAAFSPASSYGKAA